MAKILITGGAGFIGSNLVRNLCQENEVFVVDNLWRGRRENLEDDGALILPSEAHFQQLDLTVREHAKLVTKGMDTVYHLADVVAGINYVFKNQYSLYHSNTLINTHVLNAAIGNGVKNYIYVGTACSFPAELQSELNPPPLKESDTYPANPESSYGWCKLMGEFEADLARLEDRINVGVLRFHNVYGSPCDLSPETSQVIPALCRKAWRHPDEPFVVWGSGDQRRAFVYVDDIIAALLEVEKKGMNQGVIQIGPDESHSIREIAETIVSISGRDIQIEYDRSRQEGDKDRLADFTRAREILGWEPRVLIREGLERTYEWCSAALASLQTPSSV
jgi:nucleoside-diphosphate-sugar epimerase